MASFNTEMYIRSHNNRCQFNSSSQFMTPLEQFNEEENLSTTGDEKRRKLIGVEKLAEEFVTELHEEIRATKGISDWRMKEIFTQKLAAHKELILKMVKEKLPQEKFLFPGITHAAAFCIEGHNSCLGEIKVALNNLDTI